MPEARTCGTFSHAKRSPLTEARGPVWSFRKEVTALAAKAGLERSGEFVVTFTFCTMAK